MTSIDLEQLWSSFLEKIQKEMGKSVFELWFKPIKLVSIKEKNVIVEIPNRFFREWIEDNYPTLISDVLGTMLGTGVALKYRITDKEDVSLRRLDSQLENRKTKLAHKGIHLNPKYTFENFVVGPSNQLAHAAAKRVAENPGGAYNPLFIYGGVGLGKTHLINAVGNAIVDSFPDKVVCYLSSERFTSEVVSAIRHEKMGEFKEKYRNVDVLLVDDIQFIATKPATQEEFFHTFNSLYEKQRQIVISSDRPPMEISDITDRLRSRFSMGLIADIQAPETETKVAIIHKKAAAEKLLIPDEVAYFIATKVKSNIRELEGCLIKLGAHSSLTGSSIDLSMTKNVLKDLISEEHRPLTVEGIVKTVGDYFGVKSQEIKSRKRTKEIVNARQIAMYLAKRLTPLSLTEIGVAFGGKDHATVIYACRQVEEKRAGDDNFSRHVENVRRKIEGE